MHNNMATRSSYKAEKLRMLQYIRERKAEDAQKKLKDEAKVRLY